MMTAVANLAIAVPGMGYRRRENRHQTLWLLVESMRVTGIRSGIGASMKSCCQLTRRVYGDASEGLAVNLAKMSLIASDQRIAPKVDRGCQKWAVFFG